MDFKGAQVYEDDDFLRGFLNRRNREESPNNVLGNPVIMGLSGSVENKAILDLGCGDGRFGMDLIQRGCLLYEGVDGSKNMVEEAKRHLTNTASLIHHSTLEDWDFPVEKYDLVFSRMVLHYLEGIEPTIRKVYLSLHTNVVFILSIQHPVLTSSMASSAQGGNRTDWIVDHYFHTGIRSEPWIGKKVVKYHRTIQCLSQTGFRVDALRECAPSPEYFASKGEYERRRRIPLFLVFCCSKPL
ncbi:class I SAM-dependent methyltransferase [Mesobacillus foraminis]|uniref:class I SAM-dependent DNA methyltransferase n=1 Tax=Mesobacillus foraminis TaxID=279826 RepID=UPI001BE5F6C1|nr:class I SAM-dependent methyltransferase [Mesobacillus foraminis]MBT2755387.1 class I SAM-dependent methyltransferase [Mesobacillus foraminis]